MITILDRWIREPEKSVDAIGRIQTLKNGSSFGSFDDTGSDNAGDIEMCEDRNCELERSISTFDVRITHDSEHVVMHTLLDGHDANVYNPFGVNDFGEPFHASHLSGSLGDENVSAY